MSEPTYISYEHKEKKNFYKKQNGSSNLDFAYVTRKCLYQHPNYESNLGDLDFIHVNVKIFLMGGFFLTRLNIGVVITYSYGQGEMKLERIYILVRMR